MKTDFFAFESRSKVQEKPRRPTSASSSSRTVPIRERIRTDTELGAQSNQAYPVAKSLNTLRHGDLLREEDGAIEFWRQMIFGTNLITLNIGLMMHGRARWQEAEATRKDFSIVLTSQDKKSFTPSSSRTSRTQSDQSYTSGQCVNSVQSRAHLHSVTNSVNRTPSHVTFSRDPQHIFQY